MEQWEGYLSGGEGAVENRGLAASLLKNLVSSGQVALPRRINAPNQSPLL